MVMKCVELEYPEFVCLGIGCAHLPNPQDKRRRNYSGMVAVERLVSVTSIVLKDANGTKLVNVYVDGNESDFADLASMSSQPEKRFIFRGEEHRIYGYRVNAQIATIGMPAFDGVSVALDIFPHSQNWKLMQKFLADSCSTMADKTEVALAV